MRSSVAGIVLTLALIACTNASGERSGICSSPSAVVLGSTKAIGPPAGWGTCAPRAFSNGGDAVGAAWKIHWTRWGTSMAIGRGLTATYGPQGGVTGPEVI